MELAGQRGKVRITPPPPKRHAGRPGSETAQSRAAPALDRLSNRRRPEEGRVAVADRALRRGDRDPFAMTDLGIGETGAVDHQHLRHLPLQPLT